MKKRYTYNRLSGTDIVVNDAMRGVVEDLKWDCASTQISKNMINPNLPATSQTILGITVTRNNDETWTISGTSTGNVAIALTTANVIPLLSGVAYTNQLIVVSGTFAGTIAVTVINSGGTITYNYMNVQTGILTKTVTPTENKTIRGYEYYCGTGTTINATIKVQLEQSVVATAWTSYNPTPDYPVTIYSTGDSGTLNVWTHKKNMFDISAVTWGKYDVYPNNAGNFDNSFKITIPAIAGTTYSIKFVNAVNAFRLSYQFVNIAGTALDGVYWSINTNSRAYENVTAPAGTVAIILSQLDVSQANGGNFQIQLEKGSTATTYEPYTGSVVPITLPQKNIFNTRFVSSQDITGVGGTYTIINDNSYSFDLTNASSLTWKYITFKVDNIIPNTDYFIKCNITTTGGGDIYTIVCINPTNETGKIRELYGINTTGISFNSGSNSVLYIKLAINSGSRTIYTLSDIQLEKGSTATTYEPYVGYVGGSLPNGVADTEALQKIGKVVLNGSESWTVTQSTANAYYYYCYNALLDTLAKNKTNATIVNEYCDKLKVIPNMVTGTTVTTDSVAVQYQGALKLRIMILKSRVDAMSGADLQAKLKAYLASNNVTVYYELATPTSVSITTTGVPTYEGVNTITTTNNIKPTISIEAWKR